MKAFYFTLSLLVATSLAACAQQQPNTEPAMTDTPAPAAAASSEQPQLAGQYSGVFPCASCPGINVRLTLSPDNSYLLEETYQDSENLQVNSLGRWDVNAQGHIELEPSNSTDTAYMFRTGENGALHVINKDDGKDAGEHYVLTAQHAGS